MENKEKGSFVGSVLLSSPVWDAEKLKKDCWMSGISAYRMRRRRITTPSYSRQIIIW